MEAETAPPVVLLIEPSEPKHQHADLLTQAGFRVASAPLDEVMSGFVTDVKPAIIAVELDADRAQDVLHLAQRVHTEWRLRDTPVIVYGHGLSAEDIEHAARAGALWLQLEPSDGNKLVAAIRGVLAASNAGNFRSGPASRRS